MLNFFSQLKLPSFSVSGMQNDLKKEIEKCITCTAVAAADDDDDDDWWNYHLR